MHDREDWLRLKPVAYAAVLCAVLVTLSVLYIDRPVERWVLTHTFSTKGLLGFFDLLASPSLLPLPAAFFYLAFYTLRRVSGWAGGRLAPLYLELSIAVAVGTVNKDELKWLIGRPWPASWVKYGLYQIKPLFDNVLYGGFPSGHTTYIAAPMFVLWWRLPQYRPLWLAIIVAVMVGLVGSGHHFVADVIAGFFLGLASAAGTLAVGPRPGFFPETMVGSSGNRPISVRSGGD